MAVITGRNEVVAEVIFLHLFVILFTGGGGCLPRCMLGYHTPPEQTCPREQTPPSRHPLEQTCPREQTPPRSRHSQADTPGTDTPPGSRHPPEQKLPPPRSRLRHTVNERPVRILLECILVFLCN